MTEKDLVVIIRKDDEFFNYTQTRYKKIPKGKEFFFRDNYNSKIYKVPYLFSSKKRLNFNFKQIEAVNNDFNRNDFEILEDNNE